MLFIGKTSSPDEKKIQLPTCLTTMEGNDSLMREKQTYKLILDQYLILTAPHTIEALLRGASEHWLSNAYLSQYLALLLENPQVWFKKVPAINPVTILPDDNP